MRRATIAGLVLCLLAALSPATAASYHIVNGRPAPTGAYPWMAAFLFDGGQGCGGSVVAPNWILTAAHCVMDERGQPSVTPAQVSFRVNTNNWTDTNGETLTAAEIIPHPNYDATRTLNDIALIRTNESTSVTPIAIAGPADLALNDPPTVGRVIGYGTTSSGGTSSEQLLEVDVAVVSDTDCQNGVYGNQIAPDAMVCAGTGGFDSCQGDSGGPLFDVSGGAPVQFGVVSFGIGCGTNPGVYAQVTTYTDWLNGIIGGDLAPGQPDPGPASEVPTGAAAPPIRISAGDGNDPVANAIAVSQFVFLQEAFFGVLAASAAFPDALGGSSLGFFGPVLYVDAAGNIGPETLTEFQRVVPAGGTIFILGGPNAVSVLSQQALEDAGFEVVRLGGAGRQQTAKLVADLATQLNQDAFGGTPFNAAIVAFEGNWPDAVAVGQISAWFGIPVLLTPTGRLGDPAREFLTENAPSLVLVIGGTGVISDATAAEIAAITGEESVIRLGGSTRLETGATVTTFNRFALFPDNEAVFGFEYPDPDTIIVANLRRDDAFAHLLATSPMMGNFGSVVVPLEGAGTSVDPVVLESICGMDAEVLVIGGTDLVSDGVLSQIQAASANQDCAFG